MNTYNSQLFDLAKQYNQARQELGAKIDKLAGNRDYSEDYKRNQISKLNEEINTKFTSSAEDLLNKISTEKKKAMKALNETKFPLLKNNPGGFESAYSNARIFINGAKSEADILNEAEDALSVGRVDFSFVLLSELDKRNTGNRQLDPNFKNLLRKAEDIKQNYFDENNIKFNELSQQAAAYSGNEWDAASILDDIKTGLSSTYPFRLYNEASDNWKVDMSIGLENMRHVTKKIIYTKAMKTGNPQSLSNLA